ncbi:unnamed protein product [Ambrosiozyma monospora]|uniref:Unnamed protein product n=1 Tax=Ambrosiozyma monospora TaxID=43982 RepID=A0ACB5U5J2_AMBMO|nr:unnamed protein product [Ambrosiozyma monospora]
MNLLDLKTIIILLSFTTISESLHIHRNNTNHHKHHAHVRRDGRCEFPHDEGIVKLASNAHGWAMDNDCTDGSWCQYACPPGQLMGQWNASVTKYGPGSMDGGFYCNQGKLEKHVATNKVCYPGKGTASIYNGCSKNVAVCQTVLPGNEAMLIPTNVNASSSQSLAVPGTDYWAGTASHFYINPPGVSVEEGCVWGSTENPYGNWSPYVIGFNMDASGNTYAKLGWNPIYFETTSPFRETKPSFGVTLKCVDPSKCNGDPCVINPHSIGLNKLNRGGLMSDNAAWCIITATDYSKVKVEVFDV